MIRSKVVLLSSWFFLTVMTLWLLKPVRVATLLAHFGAVETPYVRLMSVVVVAVVVVVYSAAVNRLSRINIIRWSSFLFAATLVALWLAVRVGGPSVTSHRAFVWAIYVLVDVYAVVMIEIFWTYANDVVVASESNRLYGIIGFGGIMGGIVGGVFIDVLTRYIGPLNLLPICAGLIIVSASVGSVTDSVLRPPPRSLDLRASPYSAALEGARAVRASRYLTLMVGIVVAYEIAATLADFGINVIFERTYSSEVDLTRMYGRLGWIVSGVAIVVQLVIVPLVLPIKRIALVLPPLVMLVGAVGVVILPVIATAIILAAADRGFNYSVQQATRESLYIPLTDLEKYKSKAFIDMFVDRAAKAVAALALIGVINLLGGSVRISLVVSGVAMLVWLGSARRLGMYAR